MMKHLMRMCLPMLIASALMMAASTLRAQDLEQVAFGYLVDGTPVIIWLENNKKQIKKVEKYDPKYAQEFPVKNIKELLYIRGHTIVAILGTHYWLWCPYPGGGCQKIMLPH